MSYSYGPVIDRANLALYLDPANIKCYSGGTILKDLSGLGRNCSMVDCVVQEGVIGFNGLGTRDGVALGSYITLPAVATTTNPASKPQGVSYQWWMRFDGNQPTGHGLWVGSTTINHLEWRGSVASGSFRTESRLSNGFSFGATGAAPLELGAWYHFAIVFSNTEVGRPVRWYRDGVLFYTKNMDSSPVVNDYFEPSTFGRSTGTTTYLYAESFKGSLGLLSIYDKELSQEEILQNYLITRGRFKT